MVTSIIILSIIGLVSATLLYVISRKFHVEEDPRIDEIEAVLPGANCGGCGFAGCRNFAEQCAKATSLDNLLCPVGGNAVMQKIAPIVGMEAVEQAPRIAVVRCNGSCENRPRDQPLRRGPQLCGRSCPLLGREQLQLRLSGRRRLCGSLRLRGNHHGPGHPSAHRRPRHLHSLRLVRERPAPATSSSCASGRSPASMWPATTATRVSLLARSARQPASGAANVPRAAPTAPLPSPTTWPTSTTASASRARPASKGAPPTPFTWSA